MFNLPDKTKIVDCRNLKKSLWGLPSTTFQTNSSNNLAVDKSQKLNARKSLLKSGAGFTTIELVMASAIMAVCLSAVLALIWYERAMALNAEMAQEALYLAQGALENARVSLKNNFWQNITASNVSGVYTVASNQKFLTNWAKEISVTVSWSSDIPGNHKTHLNSLVYDPVGMAEADSCDWYLNGNWQNPQVLAAGLNLGGGNVATAIKVKNNYAYITADASSQPPADFFIVDVSDPIHPILKSSLNTGYGLADVAVAGDYAFVANNSTVYQLQIINIADKQHPFLAYSFFSGGDKPANTVVFSKNKIYLGLEKSVGFEFYILNFNPLYPALPTVAGSFETNTGINKIILQNNLVYLAVPEAEQVRILDISDAHHITQKPGFTYIGDSILNGQSLYLNGDRLYFGRNGPNNNPYHKFFSLDTLNKAVSPVRLDSKDLDTTPNAILERSGLVFLATNDTVKEFQVWQDNGQGQLTHLSDIDLPAEAVGIDCEGSTMFIVQSAQDAIKIIIPGP